MQPNSSIPLNPAPPVTTKNFSSQKQPAKAKSRGSGDLSLKTLTLAKLGRDIQNAGKKGHCSLEDAIAARDIVDWYLNNRSILGEELEKLKIAKPRSSVKSSEKREAEGFKDTDILGGARKVPSLLD